MSIRNLVVMKFGGTSLANPERILSSAQKVVQARRKGTGVVVVVSAPADMTDELLELAGRISPDPERRELDMLLSTGEQISIALFAIALRSKGIEAVSLTGAQAGIISTGAFTRAKILAVHPSKILESLKAGKVVVVAGFQGMNQNGEITTLGRGGSDLTAVALAARLKAKAAEIYTDVEGVYSADPRLAPGARRIQRLSYDEMLELASAGAQVMQARSIELAKRYNVPIYVKCSFNDHEGTWIMKPQRHGTAMESPVISGVALNKSLAKITIVKAPDRPGIAAKIFSELAKGGIAVDMIVQSAAQPDGTNDISLTVERATCAPAQAALQRAARQVGAERIAVDESCAKVSVVGTGLRHDSSVAAKVFETLSLHQINIHMISTSDIKIACVISEKQAAQALRALHDAFNLGRPTRRSSK